MFKSLFGVILGTVNKVDLVKAAAVFDTPGPGTRPPGNVTQAPYREEPYIRVQYPDGTTRDGKAVAWTRTWVLLHTEKNYVVHNEWVPAHAVTRIPREQSDWQDPYDVLW